MAPGPETPFRPPAVEQAQREWILLVPLGCNVTQTTSGAVEVPTLVTREQILAIAEAAATLKAAGLEADVGDLLRRHIRPDLEPPEQGYRVVPTSAPVRSAEYPCSCGIVFKDELRLQAHIREWPEHDLKYLPPERRVDS